MSAVLYGPIVSSPQCSSLFPPATLHFSSLPLTSPPSQFSNYLPSSSHVHSFDEWPIHPSPSLSFHQHLLILASQKVCCTVFSSKYISFPSPLCILPLLNFCCVPPPLSLPLSCAISPFVGKPLIITTRKVFFFLILLLYLDHFHVVMSTIEFNKIKFLLKRLNRTILS